MKYNILGRKGISFGRKMFIPSKFRTGEMKQRTMEAVVLARHINFTLHDGKLDWQTLCNDRDWVSLHESITKIQLTCNKWDSTGGCRPKVGKVWWPREKYKIKLS